MLKKYKKVKSIDYNQDRKEYNIKKISKTNHSTLNLDFISADSIVNSSILAIPNIERRFVS